MSSGGSPILEQWPYLIAPVAWVLLRSLGAYVARLVGRCYYPWETHSRTGLTVLSVVYREDASLFASALRSWQANSVGEIICVISTGDKKCQQVARDHGVTVIEVATANKCEALAIGCKRATAPVVCLVDSDTLWEDDVATTLCAPFADAGIGAVCAAERVLHPRTTVAKYADMHLRMRYFVAGYRSQSALGQALSCLPGRTAAYRAELLTTLVERLPDDSFLGRRWTTGDDKRLTARTLASGYRTVVQASALVSSPAQERLGPYLRQRLRHLRDTWRVDLITLRRGRAAAHPYLGVTMIARMADTLAPVVAVGYVAVLLVTAHPLAALLVAVLSCLAELRGTAGMMRRTGYPRRLVLQFAAVRLALRLVGVAALLTIRRQAWLTR